MLKSNDSFNETLTRAFKTTYSVFTGEEISDSKAIIIFYEPENVKK